MDAVPAVSFTEAWTNCRRLLGSGYDLSLVLRSSGQCIALISNGTDRRWADGADEVAALAALEDLMLAELADTIP